MYFLITIITRGSVGWACVANLSLALRKLNTESSIDDSYQVWVHLGKRFQRKRFFRNRSIKNENCLWRPCLTTDKNEMSDLCRGPSIHASYWEKMSNLYRGPSIEASYQVLVHLAKRIKRRYKKKSANQK